MTRARKFEVPAHLYPFESHWFEREGVAMHYVDEGEGMPIVMLHGNPTWSFLYRDIIQALPAGYRALAPDYPGFGQSDHPPGYGYTPEEHAWWVRHWLDDLDIDEFVLVVQDWGGPIGMWNATGMPDRIAGLVILNTWAWPPHNGAKVFSHIMGGSIGRRLCLKKNFFADTIVKKSMYYAKAKSPDVFKAYTDPFPTESSRLGTWVFPRAIRTETAWLAQIESRLDRLRGKPVEFVWAMKDIAFANPEVMNKWKEYFPDAPWHEIAKASHYIQEDAPEFIAETIVRVAGSRRQ